MPTVTTVTGMLGGKEGLMYWAWEKGMRGEDYRERAKEAATVGSIAHNAVEADLKGEPFDLDALPIFGEDKERVRRCISAWREWREQSRIEMIASELTLVSPVHLFGGTLDAASVYSHRGIVDIKTGKGPYLEQLAQVRAYGALWNERHPEQQIEEYHLIFLGKNDGSFHHHRWDAQAMAPLWDVFLHALEIHRAQKRLKEMAA